MRSWRNGRRNSFRGYRLQGRESSSLSERTNFLDDLSLRNGHLRHKENANGRRTKSSQYCRRK